MTVISNPPAASVPTRNFALQIIISLLVLASANVLIARMARNSVPRQLIRQIDTYPNATVLACGNSLMAAAFNEPQFQNAWDSAAPAGPTVKPLNIALGASGTVEQLLLLRHAFNVNHAARIIIYGFYNQQLTEIPTGGWDDLTGNRAMDYYVEPYFAADLYAPRSNWEPLQIGLIGHVPMLVERLTLWAKVEKVRRKMEEIGMPHQAATVFGRVKDFASMEVKDDAEFARTCQKCVTQNLPLTPSVEQMIDATMKRHLAFVVIEMPMSTNHRRRLYSTPEWHAYERHVQALAVSKGAIFINASNWLPDDHFADDLHAGAPGAIDFCNRLATELKPLLAGQVR